MRGLGITAAAVIGGIVGMFVIGGIAMAASDTEAVEALGTLAGALAGAIGLGWWVARLIPAKPRNLQRGRDIMRDRQQRIVRRRSPHSRRGNGGGPPAVRTAPGSWRW